MNIIKSTLEEKLAQLEAKSKELYHQKIYANAERFHYHFEKLVVDHGLHVTAAEESIYIKLDEKEILSIHARTYGKPYLNTYATTLDSAFEFERLVVNGKFAEKFLKDEALFEKIFKNEDVNKKLSDLYEQQYAIRKEILAIEAAEAEEAKAKAKQALLEGSEFKFDAIKHVATGPRRYDYVSRVVGLKVVAVSKNKKKVDVEFECQNWDADATKKITLRDIKVDYLLQNIA